MMSLPATVAMLLKYTGATHPSFAAKAEIHADPLLLYNHAHGRPPNTPLSDADRRSRRTTSLYKPMSEHLVKLGVQCEFPPWAADLAGFQEGLAEMKRRLSNSEPTIIDVAGLYLHSHS